MSGCLRKPSAEKVHEESPRDAERSALGSRVSGSKRFSCLLRLVARKKENAKADGREGAGAGGPADVIKRPSLTLER
jgi:hypothetical protein